jgi:hypothetical protein
MIDWIRRTHKQSKQCKESPSTEAFNKFLGDLEKTDRSSYWQIIPWNLTENDFAEFLEKLISDRDKTRSKLEVQRDQLEVQRDQLDVLVKTNLREYQAQLRAASEPGLTYQELYIAGYKMELTRRRGERLNADELKIVMADELKIAWKQGIIDKLSKFHQFHQEFVDLHRRFKKGSLTLAEIEMEIFFLIELEASVCTMPTASSPPIARSGKTPEDYFKDLI